MSDQPSSASQQASCTDVTRRVNGGQEESESGGISIKVYLHCVSDTKAALLSGTGKNCPIKEIRRKTGADVQLPINPSIVKNVTFIVIRGSPSQIESAVRLINQKTDAENMSAQAEAFWLQWVEEAFPDLNTSAYFLPPLYVNRVPTLREIFAGQDVLVLQPKEDDDEETSIQSSASDALVPQPARVQESDVRDDAAMQRVLMCLQEMFKINTEVLVGLSQLQFGQYLSKPCYAPAAAQLPLPLDFPPNMPENWRQGDFDVLLIHRDYGFVVFEVKAFGDNVKELNMTQQDIDKKIRKKLKDAMTQLDKAEAMLSHLVSDIAPGLRITKTIAFPNLTACQVQTVLSGDPQLAEDLSRCLGIANVEDISSFCLCSDLLFDTKEGWELKSLVLKKLENWWQRRVGVAGHDSHMTPTVYRSLVARFCGPATTVSVPCTSPPRLSIKTLGQAVSATGEFYTAQITLYPEQVDLLNAGPPVLFLTGPPGTGKTVMLMMRGIEWLRCGKNVEIVSSFIYSRTASIMLYHLLLEKLKTINKHLTAGQAPAQVRFLQLNFRGRRGEKLDKKMEKVVNDFSQKATAGALYILADEEKSGYFDTFCAKLWTRVPCLHVWAASLTQYNRWPTTYLTRPLRSPPAVIREVEQDEQMSKGFLTAYSERGVPDYTDGPPVKRLYHRGQGHTGTTPVECIKCGHDVASFLRSLNVGIPDIATTTSTNSGCSTPPGLKWRDVLVLSVLRWNFNCDIETGLREKGIPVRLISTNEDDIEDLATARSDVVWIAYSDVVRGLERKIVVILGNVEQARLPLMSRCTSQLLIIH